MSKKVLHVGLMVVLTALLAGCGLFGGTEVPDVTVPILVEDFSDPEGVTIAAAEGHVEIRDGKLYIRGVNPETGEPFYTLTNSLTGNQNVSDFTVEYDYTPLRLEGDKRIVVRSQRQNEAECYNFRIGFDGDQAILVLLKDGNHGNPIVEKRVGMEAGNTYRVKITMEDTLMKVWLSEAGEEHDDEPTLEHNFDDGEPRYSGTFHFTSWGGEYTIDNLVIYATANVPQDA